MLLRESKLNENNLEKFKYFINTLDKEREQNRHTILIVDDEKDNLQLLHRTLRKKYNILTASNGVEALDIVKKEGSNISLIVSDQRMPNMTGTEFLAQVAENYPYIVKMLLTGYTDLDAMVDGVNKCNLFQYISKPVDPNDLELIVNNGINAYELTLSKNTLLNDLRELFFTTVKSISSALDAKDTYTHGHSHRVTLFSLVMAQEMELDENFIEEIETAGLLHDIGKIGVPEDILCKPGRLTDEEYNTIKQHAASARKILDTIPGLKNISLWASCHHERWDGKGYPNQFKEEEIPLPARILAVADTYDAMTSNRSYRKGLPHEVAAEEIKNCGGTQFDPKMIEVFIKVENIFKEAAIDPVKFYDQYSRLNKAIEEKEIC
ncbi:MAG TPA: HD domain-containing phosphohydrolase [Candidatus Gastranaerophilales bacterium]|nr:HD domain-containing phosphohydrolase [Candidatus Gastranaerophilales bacterium]